MLPDLSPAHILIVVIVALVVVGPKDLPMLLRKIGQFMGKMRGMANEFRASFDEMARQSELDELRKEVEAMRAAASAATPDLGLDQALNTDAEGSYMAQWQAAQPDAYVAPETAVMTPLPPAMAEAAAETPAPPAAPKPRARARTAKPPADDGEPAAAPKPRARKPKPEAETGA